MWCGVVWCGVVWCGVVWCGVVWGGVVWGGVVWCGVVWCGVVLTLSLGTRLMVLRGLSTLSTRRDFMVFKFLLAEFESPLSRGGGAFVQGCS